MATVQLTVTTNTNTVNLSVQKYTPSELTPEELVGIQNANGLNAGNPAATMGDISGKTDKGGYEGTAMDLKDELDAITGGSQGAISISDTPTEIGYYHPTESGTYANAGGLVVDLTAGVTILIYDGTNWGMQVVPVDLGYVFEVSDVQIFDKENFIDNMAFLSNNAESSSTGSAITPYYDIPDGTLFISWQGIQSSAGKRFAWLDDEDNFISTNTVSTTSGTIAIPDGAVKFRMRFKAPADTYDILETFMLNYGSAPATYEPYETIDTIRGTRFLKEIPSRRINEIYLELAGTSPTVNASGWYKACPVVEDEEMKGCTGYGYDAKRNLHIVAEYNTTISSKVLIFRPEDLVERNLSDPQISTPFKTFDITALIDHIQGVTWDWVDDTYLALGTAKGEATTGHTIVVKLSTYGVVLDLIQVPDMIVQVGMIDLDIDGNILIKPNAGGSVYIFNRNYYLIDRKTLLPSEGLAVNKYNGEIWSADSDFNIKKYDKNYNELAEFEYNTFTNESAGSNVEGMAIIPDGSLVICADAFLHGGTELGNCLFFFDFESTVNKRRYFYLPNGNGDYKNNTGEYLSEIVVPGETITGVVSDIDYDANIQYRSGANVIAASLIFWGSTIISGNAFQVKVR